MDRSYPKPLSHPRMSEQAGPPCLATQCGTLRGEKGPASLGQVGPHWNQGMGSQDSVTPTYQQLLCLVMHPFRASASVPCRSCPANPYCLCPSAASQRPCTHPSFGWF